MGVAEAAPATAMPAAKTAADTASSRSGTPLAARHRGLAAARRLGRARQLVEVVRLIVVALGVMRERSRGAPRLQELGERHQPLEIARAERLGDFAQALAQPLGAPSAAAA